MARLVFWAKHFVGASISGCDGPEAFQARTLHFCHEAGPTVYGLYRQVVESGNECAVVALFLTPKRPDRGRQIVRKR